MSKKEIKYTDEEIGDIKFISDFLPPPEDLVLKEKTVKITLSLTKESVDFFKKIAQEQDTHYQTMIRSLLDQYTEHFDKSRRGAIKPKSMFGSRSSPKAKFDDLEEKEAKNHDRHIE